MSMRRRKHEEDNENHDRWLVSYADFITLLFAFFVVMYAISSVNQGKYRQLTSSLGSAFGTVNANPSTQNASTPSTQSSDANGNHLNQKPAFIEPIAIAKMKNERLRIEREKMQAMAADIEGKLEPLIKDGKIEVIQSNKGLRIDIHDSLLFTQGSAKLEPSAYPTLQQIVQILSTNNQIIQIEGHTDNVPIKNSLFASNWELSAIRATSVVTMFSAAGIADNRLSATGFGASRPVAENSSPDGQAKNRRVSIMILREAVAETEPAPLSAQIKNTTQQSGLQP